MSHNTPSANDVPAWDQDDASDQLKQMFVDMVQQRRIELGQKPAKRPVFLKAHGVAKGVFELLADLPEALQPDQNIRPKLTAFDRRINSVWRPAIAPNDAGPMRLFGSADGKTSPESRWFS